MHTFLQYLLSVYSFTKLDMAAPTACTYNDRNWSRPMGRLYSDLMEMRSKFTQRNNQLVNSYAYVTYADPDFTFSSI